MCAALADWTMSHTDGPSDDVPLPSSCRTNDCTAEKFHDEAPKSDEIISANPVQFQR
jgi:hypothetical protein